MYLLKEHLKHKTETIMKKYVCVVCGWVYDPEVAYQLSGRIPQDNQMAQLIIGCAFLLLSLHDCDKKKSATYISDCALYKS